MDVRKTDYGFILGYNQGGGYIDVALSESELRDLYKQLGEFFREKKVGTIDTSLQIMHTPKDEIDNLSKAIALGALEKQPLLCDCSKAIHSNEKECDDEPKIEKPSERIFQISKSLRNSKLTDEELSMNVWSVVRYLNEQADKK